MAGQKSKRDTKMAVLPKILRNVLGDFVEKQNLKVGNEVSVKRGSLRGQRGEIINIDEPDKDNLQRQFSVKGESGKTVYLDPDDFVAADYLGASPDAPVDQSKRNFMKGAVPAAAGLGALGALGGPVAKKSLNDLFSSGALDDTLLKIKNETAPVAKSLSDLFTMPKVREAMVEDALVNPGNTDMVELLDIKDPLAFLDEMGSIDNAYNQLYNDTSRLEDFGENFLEEIVTFVKTGETPKDAIAKSMVDSLYDSGLKNKEARFFMDSEIPDIVKPESGTFMKKD